jgi:hypothetical protein
VTYQAAEARQQILEVLGGTADHLSVALSQLGAAYELLDERAAEQLEDALFGPVKRAYGRTRRAHETFAQRHELPARAFEPAAPAAPAHGAQGLMESAAELVGASDSELAELQDSMLPVEVGDEPLRADIEGVRQQLADYRAHTRALVRTLGR